MSSCSQVLAPPSELRELRLRRAVDRAVGRALVDRTYERQLLADPAAALGPGAGGVYALDLEQFALQMHLRLWPQHRPDDA
jgi:hypothetical protein